MARTHDDSWDLASSVGGVPREALFTRNGLEVPALEDDDPLGEIIFVSGTPGS